MWSMILLMSRLQAGHSMSAGRRSEKLSYQQSIGTTRRLVKTERSDRRLGRSATHVKRPRYPGASPWITLYVNTAILNSILSGTRSQSRQASASEMWSDRRM